jgi:hypothetical protein
VWMLLSAMVACYVDTRVGWREDVQKCKGWRVLYVLGAASKERPGCEVLFDGFEKGCERLETSSMAMSCSGRFFCY